MMGAEEKDEPAPRPPVGGAAAAAGGAGAGAVSCCQVSARNSAMECAPLDSANLTPAASASARVRWAIMGPPAAPPIPVFPLCMMPPWKRPFASGDAMRS